MTTKFHPVTDYRACVDPLHRNTWPVRVELGNDAPVIGNLTEHITVNFDGDTPPHVRWSWAFDGAEADRLGIDEDLRASRGRYRSWRSALEQLAQLHQLAVALRAAEEYRAARRATGGE